MISDEYTQIVEMADYSIGVAAGIKKKKTKKLFIKYMEIAITKIIAASG